MPPVDDVNFTLKHQGLEGLFSYDEIIVPGRFSEIELAFDIWDKIGEIATSFILILSLVACISLLYIFGRNSRITTITKIYFVHFAIWSLVDLVVSGIFIKIYMRVDWIIPFHFLHCIETFNDFSRMSRELFLIAPGIDWFLIISNSRFIRKHEEFQKYLIGGIYLISSVAAIIILLYGLIQPFYLWLKFYSGLYIRSFVCIIIIYLNLKSRNVNNDHKDNKCYLIIATREAFCLLPFLTSKYIYFFIVHLGNYFSEGMYFLLCTIDIISEMCLYSLPIIVVYTLYQYNESFKAVVKASKERFDSNNVSVENGSEHESMQNVDSSNLLNTRL